MSCFYLTWICAPGAHADVVVTNPPFGKKSSITIVNEEGDTDRQSLTYNRPDFWTTTSNKQLNFVQHVKSLLKVNGRAAVVVPDHRHILRAGCQSQRALLRPEARRERTLDQDRVGLRPPHQPAFHAQDQDYDPV